MSESLRGLPSELTEPYLAKTIGILWDRFERSEKTREHYRTLWDSMRALNLLTVVACKNGIGSRASLVMASKLGDVAKFVKAEIGVNPYREWRVA